MLDGEDEALAPDDEIVEDGADPADDDAPDAGDERTEDVPSAEEAEDEDVISFGGTEARGEDEPEHIRDLRQRYRDEKRRREEAEAKLAPKDEDAGPEPTLNDPDVEWDEGKFIAKHAKWQQAKAAVEERTRTQREQQEAAQREYEADVQRYNQRKAGLKVKGYAAAEERALAGLTDMQQAIIVQAADKPEAVLFRLGSQPDELKRITAIKNPVKLAAAITRLDMETQVTRKPTTPVIEPRKGSGSLSNGSGAHLEKLEAEARRTGNRTALNDYRRQKGIKA